MSMFDKMMKQMEHLLDSETINKMISEKQEEIRKMINKPINVKVVNKSSNPLPEYATEGSAGMDLSANTTEDIVLNPFERKMIPTGIYIQLPERYEAQIRPRSGLAIKYGISIINCVGTIDSDYRGEICVLLVNLSNDPFTIHNGDRIAQMIINKYETCEWILVDELNETERGDGGYGSTGIK